MISALGTMTMLACAGFGVASTVTWAMCARDPGRRRMSELARWCAGGLWVSAAASVALMEWALLTSDFSVGYVAETGSRDVPLFTTVTSLWAGAGGSLLLWQLVLGSCIAVFALRAASRAAVGAPAHAAATAVLAAVFSGFAFLTAFGAAPFRSTDAAAASGAGPNPLLQDHPAMAVHPPLLYVGFAGLAVPFALAVGALLAGRVDRAWARPVRTWTLVAWIFLTAAIGLGAWWAYGVLGWGGYWAWDPVENVSLMPWLLATALLHIVRSPGRTTGWVSGAVSLAGAAFLLVLLGTMLTRSGAVLSVHTFSDSPLGTPLLLLFLAVSVAWAALLLARRDRLGSQPDGSSQQGGASQSAVLSKQTAIRAQTVLLTLITAVVFLGTVLPVIVQALTGDRLSVGAPWFNRTTGPLALAVLALMAVGPLVDWNRDDARDLLRRLTWPAIAGLAATGVIGLTRPGGIWLPFVAGVAAFVLVTLVRQLAPIRSVSGRRRHPARRTVGALVAHAGVALAAVAVVATAQGTSDQRSVTIGETLTSGKVSVTVLGVEQWDDGRRSVAAARVLIGEDGESRGIVTPELHFYPGHAMVVADPVARAGLGQEIQVALVDVDPEAGTASFRLTVTPLLWLLWTAVGVIVLGGVIAAWPVSRVGRARRVTPEPARDADPVGPR